MYADRLQQYALWVSKADKSREDWITLSHSLAVVKKIQHETAA